MVLYINFFNVLQITKEILNDTVNKNSDIAAKLISISPELSGLADILKTEIHSSLAIIIDSIVSRFLQVCLFSNLIQNGI